MSVEPGKEAGNCLRCGVTTIMIGHGTAVFGVKCPHCDLVVITFHDVMDLRDAVERYNNEEHDQEAAYERHKPHYWGPDPNP